jgi:hypothetical protein
VLQWCYSDGTVLYFFIADKLSIAPTGVLQWCYYGVAVVLQWCYSGVIMVLQWCVLG